MTAPLIVEFAAGWQGAWGIDRIVPVLGEGLPSASHLAIDSGGHGTADPAAWRLRGTVSNMRYSHRTELNALAERQEGLGRPDSLRAVLIPIRKTAAWWALAQDERRAIFEEQSRHIRIGMDYLPAVARRLHHCRDLGEPFDFLTWFEFAPDEESRFDAMLARLRETREWAFVEREVEIRVSRAQ